jgi:ATP-dependent Clp protease adapter protein ClpS
LENLPKSGECPEERGGKDGNKPWPDEWCVLLHNDDVHSIDHVISALQYLGCTPRSARELTQCVDSEGDAVAKRGTMADCKDAMSKLRERDLIASALPASWLHREARSANILQWLAGLSSQCSAFMTIVCEILVSMGPLPIHGSPSGSPSEAKKQKMGGGDEVGGSREKPVGFATMQMAGAICKRAALLQQGAVLDAGALEGKDDDLTMADGAEAAGDEGAAGDGSTSEGGHSRDIAGANYTVGKVAAAAAAAAVSGGTRVVPASLGESDTDGSIRDALFDAVVAADVEKIKQLVRQGGDISERSAARVRKGCTVLYIACRGGEVGGVTESEEQVECVRYLLHCCPREHLRDFLESTTDRRLFTALFAAASEGRPRSLALLLAAGADASHCDEDGRTASHWARDHGHDECAELLEARQGGMWFHGKAGSLLEELIVSDCRLSKRLRSAVHSFLLPMLVNAELKGALMWAFVRQYRRLSTDFLEGRGVQEETVLNFSVQLLTVPSLVQFFQQGLLEALLLSLQDAVVMCLREHQLPPATAATQQDGGDGMSLVLDTDHRVLMYRRYDHIARDLKYVLKIPGVASQFASSMPSTGPILSSDPNEDLLRRWLGILRLVEAMDLQQRQLGSHVEFESRSWLNAFNLAISFGSIFQVALQGLHPGAGAALADAGDGDDGDGDAGTGVSSPSGAVKAITYGIGSVGMDVESNTTGDAEESSTELQVRVNRLVSIGRNTMQEINDWHNIDKHSKAPVNYTALTSPGLPPFEEPFESFAFQSSAYSVSFHLPLHRFLGALVRTAVSSGLPIKQLLRQLRNTTAIPPPGSDSETEDFDVNGNQFLPSSGGGGGTVARTGDLAGAGEGASGAGKGTGGANGAENSQEQPEMPTSIPCPLPPTLLAESPLRALVAAAQVHVGMWRRNGIALKNQVVNYWGVGLCRDMRDVDLLLLQMCTVIKGAPAMLGLIVERYSMLPWLLAPASSDARPQSTFTVEQQRGMCEEMLLMLQWMVSELPHRARDGGATATLRRELLHKLCVKDCTHSELFDLLLSHNPFRYTKSAAAKQQISQASFERVLRGPGVGLATMKRTPSGAANFALKQEYYAEYDPGFYHLSRGDHELARERWCQAMNDGAKKAAKKTGAAAGDDGSPFEGLRAQPMSGPPPSAHSLFHSAVRLQLLLSPIMVAVLHTVLNDAALALGAVSGAVSKVDTLKARGARATRASTRAAIATDAAAATAAAATAAGGPAVRDVDVDRAKKRHSENLLAKAVGILNLQMHVLSAHIEGGEDEDEDEEDGSEVGPPPLSRADAAERFFAAVNAGGGGKANGLGMQYDGVGGGPGEKAFKLSLFELMWALCETTAGSAGAGAEAVEPVTAQALCWVVVQCRKLDGGCAEVAEAVEASKAQEAEAATSPAKGGDGSGIGSPGAPMSHAQKQAVVLEKRKQMQRNAMVAMQKQQAAFSAFADEMSESDEDEDDEGMDIAGGGADGQTDKAAGDAQDESADAGGTLSPASTRNKKTEGGGTEAKQSDGSDGTKCILCHSEVAHPRNKQNVLCQLGFGQSSASILRRGGGAGSAKEPLDTGASGSTKNANVGLMDQAGMEDEMCRGCNVQYPCSEQRLPRPVHLMFCGHAMHLECWDQYYTSVHQQHLSRNYFEGQMAIDVSKREFLCPLCKSISNILVPYTPVIKSMEGAESMDVEAASDSAVCVAEMVEWVAAGSEGSGGGDQPPVARAAAGAKDDETPVLSQAFTRMLEFLTEISTKDYSVGGVASKSSRAQQAICLWRAAASSVVVASLGSVSAAPSGNDGSAGGRMDLHDMDEGNDAPANGRTASAWIGMERGLEQLQPLLQATMHPAIVFAANGGAAGASSQLSPSRELVKNGIGSLVLSEAADASSAQGLLSAFPLLLQELLPVMVAIVSSNSITGQGPVKGGLMSAMMGARIMCVAKMLQVVWELEMARRKTNRSRQAGGSGGSSTVKAGAEAKAVGDSGGEEGSVWRSSLATHLEELVQKCTCDADDAAAEAAGASYVLDGEGGEEEVLEVVSRECALFARQLLILLRTWFPLGHQQQLDEHERALLVRLHAVPLRALLNGGAGLDSMIGALGVPTLQAVLGSGPMTSLLRRWWRWASTVARGPTSGESFKLEPAAASVVRSLNPSLADINVGTAAANSGAGAAAGESSEGSGAGPSVLRLPRSLSASISYLSVPSLVQLPPSYTELCSLLTGRPCAVSGVHPVEDPALCLVTGALLAAGPPQHTKHVPTLGTKEGHCTQHANRWGEGIGVFFLLNKCTVLLMRGGRSAYSVSPYVDEHGEVRDLSYLLRSIVCSPVSCACLSRRMWVCVVAGLYT